MSPAARAPLGLIWAQSLARPGQPALIGRDGTLPWHLPEDLAHFRALTHGHPVIMGRTTWESLPARFRPLPGRENIVLSRRASWSADGARTVASAHAALDAVGGRRAWVIGGAQVYQAFVDLADRVEITEIDIDLGPPQPGDTRAPELGAEWVCLAATAWERSSNGLRYRFVSRRIADA